MRKLIIAAIFLSFPLLAAAQCNAPAISAISVGSITTSSAVVSWTTNIASDSQVYFGSYLAYEVGTGFSQTGGVTSHSVTVTGLRPGTNYWYAVRSRATCDNTKSTVNEQDQVVNNFTTSAAPTTGTPDFWFNLFGAHHVMQGYKMVVGQTSGYLQGPASASTWKIVVTGLPANSQAEWTDKSVYGEPAYSVSTTTTANDTINAVSPLNSLTFRLNTNVGGTTPAGSGNLTYTVTLTNGNGTITHTYTWPYTVDSATTLATGTPVSYPAITNLATWQSRMTTYGATWCTDTGAALDGLGLGSWMYDGIKVYQSIRSYTGDSATWTPCITDHVTKMNTAISGLGYNIGAGWKNVIAQGLYQDFALYGGSVESKKDIIGSPTGTHGLGNDFGWYNGFWTDILSMREASGAVESHRYRDKLNNVAFQPDSQLGVDVLIAIAEQVYNGNGDSDDAGLGAYQPFMVGLLANSLIYYYEDGHQSDARIPIVIKNLADYLYANAWNKYPQQPNGFFYESHRYYMGFDDTTGGSYLPDLNNLISPMYAWLFKYTGSSTYQTEGDAIFNTSVAADPSGPAAGTLGFFGKTFTQNYRWSFDYVTWRSAPAGSTLTISPTSATLPYSGIQQFSSNGTSVTWSATCGSITSAGIYTAPASTTTCTVTATPVTGTAKTATVAVSPITVTPSSASITVNSTQQFISNYSAAWSATCGTVSGTGFYTAPGSATSCTVTATAVNGSSTANASVTVNALPLSPVRGKIKGKSKARIFH